MYFSFIVLNAPLSLILYTLNCENGQNINLSLFVMNEFKYISDSTNVLYSNYNSILYLLRGSCMTVEGVYS